MGIANYFKRILITINYDLILENKKLKKKNCELEQTIESLKQKEKPKVKELLKLIERKNKIIKNIREENKKLRLKIKEFRERELKNGIQRKNSKIAK